MYSTLNCLQLFISRKGAKTSSTPFYLRLNLLYLFFVAHCPALYPLTLPTLTFLRVRDRKGAEGGLRVSPKAISRTEPLHSPTPAS